MDDWLYGVARVREKLAAWENLVMLAEGLKNRPPMELTPFQLPYRANDSWLALEYPESHVIAGDTMLYTAFAPAIDPAGAIVGLLVDEWTETIPVREETTALTFHYDRPNCEAPQSLLLVTPSTVERRVDVGRKSWPRCTRHSIWRGFARSSPINSISSITRDSCRRRWPR